jgi:hypothetical protein
MRTLITLAIALFCLQMWAQRYNRDSTIIDSLYAIPELDGGITADSTGVPIYLNSSTYEFVVGDLSGWIEHGSSRGYVSYPLPVIPDGYELVNTTMRLYQYKSIGCIFPESHEGFTYYPYWNVAGGDTIKCIISHVDYGISLDLGDWAKGDEGNPYTYNPNVGEITWEGINEPGNEPGHHGEAGYRYLDITDCVLHDLAIGSIFSQYRIAFQINTDYDYGPDFVSFLSANSNSDYPEFLPIMYFTLYNPTFVSDDLSPAMFVNVISSPNPFSSRVTFGISLKEQTELSIKLYDLRGRVAKELSTTHYSKGTHNISMDTNDLSNGIYLLQVKAGSEMITKKITCLK